MASAIQAATGVALRIEGPCPGGQVGAAYVTWPDGHRSVLTWRPATRFAAIREGPLAVIEALRPAGYPAPAAELAVQAGDDMALVWELLPGTPLSHLTPVLLQEALTLNNLQAGQLAGHPAIPPADLYLTRDGPGFCLHQPLREHSARTRALHRWITTTGASHPRRLSGDDAVHYDYQPANILASHDHITGVIDWDGAARGDRHLDLVTLRFGIHAITADPAATTHLDQLLDNLLGVIPCERVVVGWRHREWTAVGQA